MSTNEKIIIYQVFTRLFGNNNTRCKYNGSMDENGCGKMADFTTKALNEIKTPKCPVYQNVDALPHTDPAEIKANLIAQLTGSVRWTQTVMNMVADGADDFTECGPGAVLQGMIKKISKEANAHGIE